MHFIPQGLVDDIGTDLASTLMTQLAAYRREVLRLLRKHERDGGSPDQPGDDAAAASAAGSATGAKAAQAARNQKRFNAHMRWA